MEIKQLQPELFKHFLNLAQEENLSHAYLFVGGFGNFDLALFLAKYIFCQAEDPGVRPCGICPACLRIAAGEFIDLHLVKPEGQVIKVDQIRDLLVNFSESGFESKKKVMIIQEAEKMGAAAANSLLKSIEEPQNETYIFLLTANENQILPTIRSRVQLVHFKKDPDLLVRLLMEAQVLRTEAEMIAQISHSVEEGLSLARSDWFFEGHQKMASLAGLSNEEAILSLPGILPIFEERYQQSLAFDLLLVLFNRRGLVNKSLKTFEAQEMWQSNVRFQSALESIFL